MELDLDMQTLIANAVADQLYSNYDFMKKIETHIKAKIDKLFAEEVEDMISSAVDKIVTDGFNREYIRTNSFGEAIGEPTTIAKSLESMISSYWTALVDKSGKPTSNTYNAVTRAEYLMTKICADDFEKGMKPFVVNVTGALKDGLRKELASHMDKMLNELFRVKTSDDKGTW